MATALMKFPKKRGQIIRDDCSVRFTEGISFSMNVEDEHKNQKSMVHKVSLTQNYQIENTLKLATAKYTHACCMLLILVSH